MAIQFHETVRGAKFFDHQLPQLIKALNRIADEMELKRLAEEKKNNVQKEEKEEMPNE